MGKIAVAVLIGLAVLAGFYIFRGPDNTEEIVRTETRLETLQQENQTLKARVTDLSVQVVESGGLLDDLLSATEVRAQVLTDTIFLALESTDPDLIPVLQILLDEKDAQVVALQSNRDLLLSTIQAHADLITGMEVELEEAYNLAGLWEAKAKRPDSLFDLFPSGPIRVIAKAATCVGGGVALGQAEPIAGLAFAGGCGLAAVLY